MPFCHWWRATSDSWVRHSHLDDSELPVKLTKLQLPGHIETLENIEVVQKLRVLVDDVESCLAFGGMARRI